MKPIPILRISATLLVMFCMTCMDSGKIQAQISYTSSDLPAVNDTIRTSLSVVLPGLDYTSTGSNYFWDFSSLVPLSQTVDTFVSVSSTPFLYQLVFIPNIVANLAQPVSNFDSLFPLTGLDVSDIFRYYKKSTSSYQDVGFALTFTEIPLPIKYDSPDVIYKLPVNYGNQDSSNSGFQISVPDFGYLEVDRKRVNKADGWGTVVTPYGSFNALRLKSTIYETDTFYLDTAGFGQSITREIVEYKWLANGYGLPVIQFTETAGLATVSYIDSVRLITVGIPEDQKRSKFTLYPNPAAGLFSVSVPGEWGHPVTIRLYTPDGRLVDKIYLENQQGVRTIDLAPYGLKKGLYLIEINSKNLTEHHKLLIR